MDVPKVTLRRIIQKIVLYTHRATILNQITRSIPDTAASSSYDLIQKFWVGGRI